MTFAAIIPEGTPGDGRVPWDQLEMRSETAWMRGRSFDEKGGRRR